MKDFAKVIEHTLLKPEATSQDVIKLCKEALEYKFRAVCIPSSYVALAKEILEEKIPIVVVVGFPLGNNLTDVKVFETKKSKSLGASEKHMVMHIGALKEKKI